MIDRTKSYRRSILICAVAFVGFAFMGESSGSRDLSVSEPPANGSGHLDKAGILPGILEPAFVEVHEAATTLRLRIGDKSSDLPKDSTAGTLARLKAWQDGMSSRADSISKANVAVLVGGEEIDLRRYLNKRVEISGHIVRISDEQYGSSILVSRQGGSIIVRVPVPTNERGYPQVGPGDYIKVDGILSEASANDLPFPKVIVSSTSHITPSIPLGQYFRWGLLVTIVVGLLLIYLVASFIKNRVSAFRERPYRAAFSQSGIAMILCADNLKIIDANGEAAQLLKRSSVQLSLRRLPQLFEVDPQTDLNEVVTNMPKGKKVTVEACLPDEEDHTTKLDLTFSRIKLGGREYILAVLHDITRYTDSVSQFRHFHEELLDGMPVEVSVLSAAGKYLYANGYGYEDETIGKWLIGKTDLEVCDRLQLSQDVALRRRAHRRRATISKETIQFEEVLDVRGVSRHILRTYQPVLEADTGEVAAVASYGLDVTELISSRKLLDEARVEIDKAGRLKSTFLQNINHEFRTPISGIIGFAEILEAEVPDEHREFVNLIERNGRRLMNTLNAVLDLAGLNNNEFDLNIRVLNIVDEVSQMVENSKEMAQEKGLFLRLEAGRTEVLGRVDQVCTARIVQNLIDNAIKFTSAGGIIVEIDSDDDFVNVRVLDTGVGIDADFAPHVFEDFSREIGGDEGGFEGVGVGLGISQRLAELMRGHIHVESVAGEGSMFTVSLPRAFPARGRFDKGKPRILVVDDSSDVKAMVNYVLNEHVVVEVVTNFDDMDLHLIRRKYDVILMDLGIARMQIVLDAVKSIRYGYDEIPLPIIAVDEKTDKARRETVLAGGFDHYVAKPFQKGALVGLMSTVLADLLYSGRALNSGEDRIEDQDRATA